MSSSGSSISGFRGRQALADVLAAARRQPGSGPPGAAEALARGGRLLPAEATLHQALVDAARVPDRPGGRFVAATALLLANRVQDGPFNEDLSGLWRAFRVAYFALPRCDRAALVQGHAAVARRQGRGLATPHPAAAQLTHPEEAVRAALMVLVRRGNGALSPDLQGLAPETLDGDSPAFDALLGLAGAPDTPAGLSATALLLAAALDSGDAEGWVAVTLWPGHAADWLALPPAERTPLIAAVRHLYEAHPAWQPLTGGEAAALILPHVALPGF